MTAIYTLLLILFDADTYIYIGWGLLIGLSLLVAFICLRSRRRWLKWLTAVPLGLMWIVFLWGTYVGFYQLEVTHVELTFEELPAAFDGYKIVQFSDVHVGSLTGDRLSILERAVDSINAQNADVVVFTGDLQNKVPTEVGPPVKKLLAGIKAKDGVYSIMGNHDHPMYIDGDEYAKSYNWDLRLGIDEDLDWDLLINDRHYIRRDSDCIVICGLDNDGASERFPQKGDIPRALWGVKQSVFIIMLEHDPSAWRRKILPHSHAQLTLSGHTHGGQFSFFGWSPASLVFDEVKGLYEYQGRYLYVTTGLGGVVPFRFGTPGEIVVITLRKG